MPKGIQGAVKEFDLSTARTSVPLNVSAEYMAVLDAPDKAYIILGGENNSPIDLRDVESIENPDGLDPLYLDNPSGSGTLQLFFGHGRTRFSRDIAIETALDPAVNSSDQIESNVVDRSARELGKVRVENSGGTLIDPATEGTLDSVKTAVEAIDGALASNDTDHLMVQEDSALNVSGATVTVTDNGAFNVAGTVSIQEATALDVSAATVTVTDNGAFNVAGTVTVDNPDTNTATDNTTSSGSGNAAAINASDGRTAVTVMATASGGPMAVTVEVSVDGINWYEDTSLFSANVSDGDAEAESFTTGADHVRAHGDANFGEIEISAKGA